MLQKKQKLIILLLPVLIIALIVVGVIAFGSPSERKIKAAIDDSWNGMISDNEPGYLDAINSLSSYEITDIEKGNPYMVSITVTGIDLCSVLQNYSTEDFPQTGDEAMLNEYLLGLIEKSPQAQTEVIVYAKKTDDGYHITFSDEFVDAMSGKIYSYIQALINDITGG